jgi:hypothetical protein
MTVPPFPNDFAIIRIGEAMFARTLPKPEWTHAAHVAAAVWLVAARPDRDPRVALPPAIRAYNEATGVPNTDTAGYHATITLASVLAVVHAVRGAPGADLAALANGLLSGELGHPDWLLAYWSRARLFSVAARRGWVAADRRRFPYGEGDEGDEGDEG